MYHRHVVWCCGEVAPHSVHLGLAMRRWYNSVCRPKFSSLRRVCTSVEPLMVRCSRKVVTWGNTLFLRPPPPPSPPSETRAISRVWQTEENPGTERSVGIVCCFEEIWGLILKRFDARVMARQYCFAFVPRRK